jgi:CheY-like chemotaxis protein
MTKRILVVDDQEDLRGVLRDLLTGSGYTVVEAGAEPASSTLSVFEHCCSNAWNIRESQRDVFKSISLQQGSA